MYTYPLVLRLLEMGALLAALAFTVLIWRTTRIGGFGVLAALKIAFVLQMLAFSLLGPERFGLVYSPYVSLLLGIVGALAMWNIYTHVRRIWAPAEAAPPAPTA